MRHIELEAAPFLAEHLIWDETLLVVFVGKTDGHDVEVFYEVVNAHPERGATGVWLGVVVVLLALLVFKDSSFFFTMHFPYDLLNSVT